MNIIVVGYGFYVLGNENLVGGTVMPAIIKWANLNKNIKINLTCIVKTKLSKTKANERFLKFRNKYKNFKEIEILIKTYDEIEINKNFDCAIIAIPEIAHLKTLEFLVKITDKILCVKPFTRNKSQFIKATELAKKHHTNIFIDFHKRFDPANIEFIRNSSIHKHNNGIFSFSYGQKVEMPFKYFQSWSKFSNPFQYLAPHYLDIIFQVLKNKGIQLNSLNLDGNANYLTFEENPNLVSAISCNLILSNSKHRYLINAICNWFEPVKSPFNSRQRIEFQTNSLHLISEQDNRGQLFINDNEIKIPNPHYLTNDLNYISSGYGVDSFYNFFDYVIDNFPSDYLVSIDNYELIAEVIDYINLLIKK